MNLFTVSDFGNYCRRRPALPGLYKEYNAVGSSSRAESGVTPI